MQRPLPEAVTLTLQHTHMHLLSPPLSASLPPALPPWLSKARGLFVPRGQGPGCTHPGGRTRQAWGWTRTPHRVCAVQATEEELGRSAERGLEPSV